MSVRHFAYFKRKIVDINKILDADEERRQVIDLQDVNAELMEIHRGFSSAIDEISTLDQFLEAPLSNATFVLDGKQALSQIRPRYAQNQSGQAIKEGRHFANLKDASADAIKAKDRALVEAKTKFKKENLGGCESPAMVKSRLVPTAANEETWGSYEQKYTQRTSKIDAMGREGFLESLSELQTDCEEIKEILSTFETDYPEFVDEFFNLLRGNGNKIKLSDLSAEQFSWLKENGLASQYNVSNG